MSNCECYKIGGRFIAEDPDCYEHGTQAQEDRADIRRMNDELQEMWLSLAQVPTLDSEHNDSLN